MSSKVQQILNIFVPEYLLLKGCRLMKKMYGNEVLNSLKMSAKCDILLLSKTILKKILKLLGCTDKLILQGMQKMISAWHEQF